MRSIRTRFAVAVGAFVVLFSGFTIYRTWWSIQRHTDEAISRQTELALQFDLAIRGYVRDEVRPVMEKYVGKEGFIPETMSTSFVARDIFARVRKKFPEYIIKFSSDNPRNPANMAGPEESKILRYFNENPTAKEWIGVAQIDGKNYQLHCLPRRMEQDCLRCHSRPELAPASLVARYGKQAGFGRKLGEVAALDTVGVPVDSINATIASEAAKQLLIMAVAVALLFGFVLLAFHALIGHRLALIAAHFRKYAEQGEEVEIPPIPIRGNDEIGVVGIAFNSLAARVHSLHRSLEQRMKQDLWMSEERHRLLTEAIDDVIWSSDLDLHITYVSPSNVKLRGYTPAETMTQTLDQVLTPASAEYAVKTLGSTIAASRQDPSVLDRPIMAELEFLRKDGTTVWGEVVVTFLRSQNGSPIGLVGVVRDFSQRKAIEEQLRHAKEAAEGASRAKSEFLANMSHEIRTPMTAILGFSEIISDISTDHDVREAADTITRNGEHLLAIINDILDLSRIEAGKQGLDVAECQPRQIVDDVAATMKVSADAKGLSLDVEWADDVPERIHTDPLRLRQILVNLIGNAIKFTDRGGVRVVVRPDARIPQHLMIRFDVIDTGIGLSEEQIGLLFKPFSQVDGSSQRRFGGTGLGLSLSRRLANMLGGDVSVTSTPGQASTFSVTIATGLLDQGPAGSRHASGAQSIMPQIRLHGRILLAEDGPDNQQLIAYLLRKAGAAVTIVDNGQVAVDLARGAQQAGKPFDLIIMDMQMPVMDGLDATRELRAAGCTAPIIALTAHAMPEYRQKCEDAGCSEYLAKPLDVVTLMAVVAKCLAAEGVKS
jgi:PAS domain S-box-containing protein